MFRNVEKKPPKPWGKRHSGSSTSLSASEKLPMKVLLGMTCTAGQVWAHSATSSWASPAAEIQVCTFWGLQKEPERTFILTSEHFG